MEPTVCPHEWERVTLAALGFGTFHATDTLHITETGVLLVCRKCNSLTQESPR